MKKAGELRSTEDAQIVGTMNLEIAYEQIYISILFRAKRISEDLIAYMFMTKKKKTSLYRYNL